MLIGRWPLTIKMEDLSLHILDIAENSINAGAKNIEIAIIEISAKDLLTVEIKDDGKGMDAQTLQMVKDPFYTTRTTRKIGLGLSMLEEAAQATGGKLIIESELNKGTKVFAEFQLSHIDRKPIGNIADTLVTLASTSTEANIRYTEDKNGTRFIFDTRDIKSNYPEMKHQSAEVLSFIKKYIIENTLF